MTKLVYSTNSEKNIRELIEKKTLLGREFKESLGKLCYHSSYVSKDYPKTYYSSGVIFESISDPLKYVPVDEWSLRQGKYLSGFERFMFDDLNSMLKEFPNSISAQEMIHYWREAYELILKGRFEEHISFFDKSNFDWGEKLSKAIKFVYGDLKTAKERIKDWKKDYGILAPDYLMNDGIKKSGEITEVLFDEKPNITPLATFGFEKIICNLPNYATALDFFSREK